MNQDLKIIKKQYGEKMMHLCRELFATILDNSPGTLSTILLETYAPNHFLYDDLVVKNNHENEFKNYIYKIYKKLHCTKEEYKTPVEDPVTLMKKAGYTLYECTTEADIQSFKKYYAFGEGLCTFGGDRLKRCYVYFAVKDNASVIKRSDFPHPERQDAYGTSVISIQFSRDYSHTLSIKNRYNHTVANPDATFSNNLDNIIYGLTQSFADYYGMNQIYLNNYFYLLGYVRANDGKLYKYNYEIDNVYYCPDNVVIDNYKVKKYEKEKYLVVDYFIIDLVNKKITSRVKDSFPETLGSIMHIRITKENNQKNVIITPATGEDIILELNELNQIIGLKNNNVKGIPDHFLVYNSCLQNISLDNVEVINNYFLSNNKQITTLSLPNVEYIGISFMLRSNLEEIILPKVVEIGDHFLRYNQQIKSIEFQSLIFVGDYFLTENKFLENISLPKVKRIGDAFLENNRQLKVISLPNVLSIGAYFLFKNTKITNIDLPNIEEIEKGFMCFNTDAETVILPKLMKIGSDFLPLNKNINQFYAPKLKGRLGNRMLRKLQRRRKLNTIRNLFS